MKHSRFIALLLSLALLCALCSCVTAPAVSEPEGEPTTTTATAGTTTTATEPPTTTTTTKAPETTGTTNSPFYPYGWLYPSEANARATYESYKKMSYKEYFSEPRIILRFFQNEAHMFVPLDSDPTKIVEAENHKDIYFDAKKYKKDAKQARGGDKGDGIVDFFRVDDEIWRWHIPSDTVDVVVKHDELYGVKSVCTSDIVLCFVNNHNITEKYCFDDRPGHYHVISKNLAIPYEDVPENMSLGDTYNWFQKNVYNKK